MTKRSQTKRSWQKFYVHNVVSYKTKRSRQNVHDKTFTDITFHDITFHDKTLTTKRSRQNVHDKMFTDKTFMTKCSQT